MAAAAQPYGLWNKQKIFFTKPTELQLPPCTVLYQLSLWANVPKTTSVIGISTYIWQPWPQVLVFPGNVLARLGDDTFPARNLDDLQGGDSIENILA